MTEIAKLLIDDVRTNVNMEYQSGRIPVHIASTHNFHLPILEYLLKNPKTEINAQDDSGDTVFHLALIHSSEKIVECLIQDGRIDVNKENKDGNHALLEAASGHNYCSLQLFDALLKAPFIDVNKKNKDGLTTLELVKSWPGIYRPQNIIERLDKESLKQANKKRKLDSTSEYSIENKKMRPL